MNRTIELDLSVHTVLLNLRLIEHIGIEPCFTVIPPRRAVESSSALELLGVEENQAPLAVIHPVPGGVYKLWPEDFWVEILKYLSACGHTIILTGGPGAEERELIDVLIGRADVLAGNAAGKLSFAQVAELLAKAAIFVGTDTSTTHLAASVGTPTIALFGPTSPVTWGPWPAKWDSFEPPYREVFGVQKVGNVTVIRGECRCLPFKKSCQFNGNGLSQCMGELSPKLVLEQMNKFLDTELSAGLNGKSLAADQAEAVEEAPIFD